MQELSLLLIFPFLAQVLHTCWDAIEQGFILLSFMSLFSGMQCDERNAHSLGVIFFADYQFIVKLPSTVIVVICL